MPESKRQYHQLFLRLGTHESSRVPVIVVGSNFEDGGFETWQEAVDHFRQVLVEVFKQVVLVKDRGCSRCQGLEPTSERKFCMLCGEPLQTLSDNINEGAAEWFRGWFDQEFHSFSEWEVFESAGWLIGRHTPGDLPLVARGGWVDVSGFDSLLESWDDFKDDASRFSRADVQTGTFTVDGE